MSKILIDTGFFLALGSPSDKHHKKALSLAGEIEHRQWITTWPVLTELSHLLMQNGSSKIVSFFDLYEEGAFDIFNLTQDHIPRIKTLMAKYRDQPMDLADASLVIVAEEESIGDIVSTDKIDFSTYCCKSRSPFRNLFI